MGYSHLSFRKSRSHENCARRRRHHGSRNTQPAEKIDLSANTLERYNLGYEKILISSRSQTGSQTDPDLPMSRGSFGVTLIHFAKAAGNRYN